MSPPRIIRAPRVMQQLALRWRTQGLRIAVVPTMGALHDGHVALLRAARRNADKVIATIFVNPAQFGPREDFAAYPRPFAADARRCAAAGVDVIFAPPPAAMYPPDFSTWVNEEALAQYLCGARRPGHFRGVCTVVAKLLNITQPHLALFGQKDAQQALIIQRMVRDLHLPVRIVVHPIVREPSGLAMSSRNHYLTAAERVRAAGIARGLRQVRAWHAQGLPLAAIRTQLCAQLRREVSPRIDYVSIVDEGTLRAVRTPHQRQKLLIAVALFVGRARLIDNLRLTW